MLLLYQVQGFEAKYCHLCFFQVFVARIYDVALFSSSQAAPKAGAMGKSLRAGCQACAGLYQPQQIRVAATCQPKSGGGKVLPHHFWVNPAHIQGAVP